MTPSLKKDKLSYSHSPDVSEGDLYNEESFFSNDGILWASLINEELSGPMSFYIGGDYGSYSLDWGGSTFTQTPIGCNFATDCL